jgi:hypothetical protein
VPLEPDPTQRPGGMQPWSGVAAPPSDTAHVPMSAARSAHMPLEQAPDVHPTVAPVDES